MPVDITIACYNSVDSVTVSGPPKSIASFVEKLQSDGIFAKEVNSSGYAFHSQYIASAGPTFRKNLEKVMRDPWRGNPCFIEPSPPSKDSPHLRVSILTSLLIWNFMRRSYQSPKLDLNDGSVLLCRNRCGVNGERSIHQLIIILIICCLLFSST